MQTEIVFSGFGGQGVLFTGQVLAYAAMDAGKNVTWFPSYGPEMRGGTANCTVIVSDEEIGSPLVRYPQGVIAMNLPSLDKYQTLIVPNGTLVVNTSLINRSIDRSDLSVVLIPANEIAESLGNKRMTNIVMLGALMVKLPVLPLESIAESLENHLPERHMKLLPPNLEALNAGAGFARKEIAPEVI